MAIQKLKKAGWRVHIIWECETQEREALKRRVTTYLKREGRR